MPDKPLHIAVLAEFTGGFGRGIMRGVARYARERGHWRLFVPMGDATDPAPLRTWRGDGIIAKPRSPETADLLSALPVPRVLVGGLGVHDTTGSPLIRAVVHDNQAEAALAMAHFQERGLSRVAFCRFPLPYGDHGREQPFVQAAGDGRIMCHRFQPSADARPGSDYERQQQSLAAWLASLPTPIGVWAANDLRGQHVLEACKLADLRVPEDVAVLGEGDDELLCELCDPPLSSIAMPVERLGYDAAAALDRLIAGEAVGEIVPMQPLGIVTRQSTDVVAVDDPDVAAAVRFIREHVSDPAVNVDAVLEHVMVSRSTLDRRFRETLGRTVHEQIEQARLRRAQELLRLGGLKMEDIAARSGYTNARRLAEHFRRSLGQSPSQWREGGGGPEGG